ncbi:MAG TPA: hypothetical protein VNO21_11105, partial [Polyangiaceae bacterium]|nr:hypothetical protein [Polyangiaceae bacterium]
MRAGFVDFEALGRRALEATGRRTALPARIDALPRLERNGEFWTLCYQGREIRLRNSKGLHYLAALLREPGREFHVGDLIDGAAETTTMGDAELREAGLHAQEPGDAGAWLDARAKSAYKQRLARLTDALEDAEARGDREGAVRLRQEREALAEELARAIGLGGRTRKAGSASERARINVQRRLRDVVTRVAEIDAALGRELELHVKTGVFCSWQC